jgi:hypothetical protein
MLTEKHFPVVSSQQIGPTMAAVSDLTAHTGYLLRMVSNAVSQEFARKVAGEGVTVAEWVMLRSSMAAKLSRRRPGRQDGMTRGAISSRTG